MSGTDLQSGMFLGVEHTRTRGIRRDRGVSTCHRCIREAWWGLLLVTEALSLKHIHVYTALSPRHSLVAGHISFTEAFTLSTLATNLLQK